MTVDAPSGSGKIQICQNQMETPVERDPASDDVLAEQARIGRRIEELRRAAGLSQMELAKRAEMSLDGVSRILLGRRAPHLGSLLALGRALRVDYRELLADPQRGGERRFREPVERVAQFLEGQPDRIVAATERCAHAIADAAAG